MSITKKLINPISSAVQGNKGINTIGILKEIRGLKNV
jgi:hypothetical protein